MLKLFKISAKHVINILHKCSIANNALHIREEGYEIPMSENRSKIVTALREWMLDVLAKNNWTPNAWATRAGTSATNITRFLNNGNPKHIPSSRTIEKLALAANQWPVNQLQRVPLVTEQYLKEGGRPFRSRKDMESLIRSGPHVTTDKTLQGLFAVEVTTNELNLIDIVKGDKIVCRSFDDRIERMDIAVVFKDNKLSFRQYAPPTLMALTETGKYEPMPFIENKEHIVGVGIQLIRDL